MTTSSISVGYGKVNLESTSVSLSAFLVRPEFDRVLASKQLPLGSKSVHPLRTAMGSDRGTLFQEMLNAVDGDVICVQSRHVVRGGSLRDGAIFMRVRASGPLYRVDAFLPYGSSSFMGIGDTFISFLGHADRLSANELEEFGIVVPRNFVYAFMDVEEVDECFRITQERPGIEGKPVSEVVESSSGELVRLPSSRRVRRIVIRNK